MSQSFDGRDFEAEFDALAERLADEMPKAGQSKYRVFKTVRDNAPPGMAWQIIDMENTRAVANCYHEADANHICYLLNLQPGPA